MESRFTQFLTKIGHRVWIQPFQWFSHGIALTNDDILDNRISILLRLDESFPNACQISG